MLITLRSLLLALLVYSQVYTTARQTPSNPIVDLGYATYKGVFNHTSNITSFLGVRFAAPPIGMIPVFDSSIRIFSSANVHRSTSLSSTCPTTKRAALGSTKR